MLIVLKMAILQQGRGKRACLWTRLDPARLSRIVNELVAATAGERQAIAQYSASLKRSSSCGTWSGDKRIKSRGQWSDAGRGRCLVRAPRVPVFPLRPRGKEPICRNGFKDATTDPAQVVRWWARIPMPISEYLWARRPAYSWSISTRAMAGLRIGTSSSRTSADTRDCRASHRRRRPAHHLQTSRRHSACVSGNGVDLKGSGYIVVAPSVHPSGAAYTWDGVTCVTALLHPAEAPPWLTECITAVRNRGGRDNGGLRT